MKTFLYLFIFCSAQVWAERQEQLLEKEWKFHLGECKGAEKVILMMKHGQKLRFLTIGLSQNPLTVKMIFKKSL